MCSLLRFRGAGNSNRLSPGEVKHQLTLSTLSILWACQVSRTKCCCFSQSSVCAKWREKEQDEYRLEYKNFKNKI